MIFVLLLLLCSSMSLCMDNGIKKYGVAEMQGHRLHMEDAHRIELTENYKFFGLYDGHGGREVADFAAQNLHVKCDFAKGKTDADITKALKKGFLQTHKDLDDAPINARLQGCTALVALIRKSQLFVANAGDSRAVLCSAGKAIPLSQDHKPDRSDEKKRIEDLGGWIEYNHRMRGYYVQSMLAVSRALGDKYLHPYVIPTPEIQHKTLESDDEFLILGCDGVWDVLSNQQAVDFVRAELEKDPNNFEKAAQALRDQAYSAQSMDNISVIVVDLKGLHQQQ